MATQPPVNSSAEPLPASAGIDFSETPSYIQFTVDSYRYFTANLIALKDYRIDDLTSDLTLCCQRISLSDVILVVVLTIVWTMARLLATKYVFRPIASFFQLSASDAEKMPESAWKFAFYLCTWSTMAYILLVEKGGLYFTDPVVVWQNYSLDSAVEPSIYAIYLVQLSFYLHSLHSTLRIDQWRKDSPTLMAHHVLCVLLITISLATRTHRSGLFAMFLHDGCDILLEGTKLTRYFQVQGGRTIKHMDVATNTGFGFFILAWSYARLYCFPLKQIYIASIYVTAKQIKVPFIFFIVSMLWVLLMMNIYWFTFILRLLYKVISGQIKELDDNREYSDHKNHKPSDGSIADENNVANGRYYLRQRKINYNMLHTGRSQ